MICQKSGFFQNPDFWQFNQFTFMRQISSRRPLILLALSALLFALVLITRPEVGQPNIPLGQNGKTSTATQLARQEADLATSIISLQERLRQNSSDAASAANYAQLGNLLLLRMRETGDASLYGQAEHALNEALRRDSKQLDALIGQGSLALSRHQFAEALNWAERARTINPFRAQVFGIIADAQIELGRYNEAAQTLQAMIDLRPDIASYSRVSYLRELHGDMPGAIDAMRRAVEAGNPAAEGTWWAMVQLGNLYFNDGDIANAQLTYAQTLHLSPDYPFALAGMAQVQSAQGKLGDAITIYKHLVERLPLPEFAIALGDLYARNGNASAAKQQYDIVRAIQALNAANGSDIDLEMVLFEANHGSPSPDLVTRARALYQRRPSIYAADALAWALYRTGNIAEAKHYSQESLRLGTRDPQLLKRAAKIDTGLR